jgi:hypothetical protein
LMLLATRRRSDIAPAVFSRQPDQLRTSRSICGQPTGGAVRPATPTRCAPAQQRLRSSGKRQDIARPGRHREHEPVGSNRGRPNAGRRQPVP